jgi:hypothetical protein
MKPKHKYLILIVGLLLCAIWGSIGTWLYINYFQDNLPAMFFLFIVFLLIGIIPIKIIANRGKKV